MIDRAAFVDLLSDLESCLTQWREEGVRSVDARVETLRELVPAGGAPARAVAPAATPYRPGAPSAPAPAARPAPAAYTPPPATFAPPPPPPRPPRPAGAPCSRIMAERLPELSDPVPRAQTRLLVVSESASFLGDAGTLLEKMLAAAGYRMLGTPEPLAEGSPNPPVAALLVLGQAALQALKPESLFNMVRGKWTRIGEQQAMVSYDPVYLGRMPAYKAMTWGDLKNLLEKFNLSVPPRDKKA